jgi:hypothetical protein
MFYVKSLKSPIFACVAMRASAPGHLPCGILHDFTIIQ